MPLARITLLFVALASALAPSVTGCSSVEPEVGDRLSACVDADSDPSKTVSFKEKIRPLMDGTFAQPKPCANCHYASRGTMEGLINSGLDLETLGWLRKGGRRTLDDIIVPGQPCKSAIVQKLKGTYQGARMPKDGPYWTDEQIQLMIDWIAEGAQGAPNE